MSTARHPWQNENDTSTKTLKITYTMNKKIINDKFPMSSPSGSQASVSFFNNAYSKMSTLVSWDTVFDCILHDKALFQTCAKLRSIVSRFGKGSEYREAKKQLPAIAPAAQMAGGRGINFITVLTGCTLVDIDDISDQERLKEIVQIVDACPYTMARHITPSGMGVRAIVQYQAPVSEVNYFNAWKQVNDFFAAITGCPVDESTKDPSRLSFLAHDKTAYYNPDSKPFVCVERTEIATGTDESPFEKAERITRKRHAFVTGSRHNYLVYLVFMLCKMGVAEADTADYVEQTYGSAYPEERPEVLVGSVYKNAASVFATWTEDKAKHNSQMQSAPTTATPAPKKGKKDKAAGIARAGDILRWLIAHGYIGNSNVADNKLRFNEISNVVEIWSNEQQKMVPISDRERSSLWVEMDQSLDLRVRQQDLDDVIYSDSVPRANPFKAYVEALPEWDGTDYIGQLASTVTVAGDQGYFERVFKKWFVGILPGVLCDNVVNETVLVFIGRQGIYKSTFFERLLPPELQQFYLSKTNSQRMTKDDKVLLSQNALINFEEIDSLTNRDLNQLKAIITAKSITERAAYRHNADTRKHIASFCATGNNLDFLTDNTGNRRWIPIEVISILSPRENPFNYIGLYSQALHLWKSGFQYWFDRDETRELEQHQQNFRAPNYEEELVNEIFRKPRKIVVAADSDSDHANSRLEVGTLVTTAYVARRCTAELHMQIADTRFSQAMRNLGFEQRRKSNHRYWLVVERTPEERESEKICEMA